MDTKTEIPTELRAAVVAVETVVAVAEAVAVVALVAVVAVETVVAVAEVVAVVAAVALVTDALVVAVKASNNNPGRIICKQTRHERSSN